MNNQATQYGVTVQQAEPDESGCAWRVEGVRHLPAGENGGRHHVFVDAYDEDGRGLRGRQDMRVAWDWDGRHGDEEAKPAPFEKSAPEPMANIALGHGQVARVWIEGDNTPSDVVANLHTNHDDEGEGVTRFHHSFAVVFRKARENVQPDVPPTAPPSPQPVDGERAAIAARLREMAADANHLANAVEALGMARG